MLVFSTSCNDDDDADPVGPRLDVTETHTGSDGGEITLTQGETLHFEWDARSGETSLQSLSVAVNGSNAVSPLPQTNEGYDLPYSISNAENTLYIDGIDFPDAGNNTGTTDYSFTVTDGIGLSAVVSFAVNVTALTSDLSAPQNFEWSRLAGSAGTGLSQFGLEWTSNSSTNAIVAASGDTEMYALPVSAWADVNTREALSSAIANGNFITQYTNVSATQGGTYNDVLGVIHNGTEYLINVQQGTVSNVTGGTHIGISGQYKE